MRLWSFQEDHECELLSFTRPYLENKNEIARSTLQWSHNCVFDAIVHILSVFHYTNVCLFFFIVHFLLCCMCFPHCPLIRPILPCQKLNFANRNFRNSFHAPYLWRNSYDKSAWLVWWYQAPNPRDDEELIVVETWNFDRDIMVARWDQLGG